MKHHAIIVTSFDKYLATKTHKRAKQLLGSLVTSLKMSTSNAYYSFAVLPDGSKEGWPESNMADDSRNTLWGFIRKQRYEDGSNVLEAVEVSFDEENRLEVKNLS